MNGIIGRYELRVPRDYQEIEYLKCNGTQYIDTGLVGSDLSNCEIEAIIKNETTDTTAYNFNGAFLSGSTAQFGLVATSSTECRATINFGFVSAIGVTNLALSQYHTFYIKNGLQKVDGVTIDTLNLGTLNGQKFLLFARTNSSDSSITNCPAMSLKAFSVKSNGSYIRNMIPVRRISDGVLGLYDTANNVFYTNQGTNSFIAGSDVDNWKDIPYSQLETATDVVTSLPVKVYGDGETDISLLLKGNTETSGTPSPQNPVTVDGVGEETANLFSGWTFGKSLDASTGAETINGNGAVSDYISVDFNTNPTYMIKPIYIGFNSFIAAYNSSNQFLGRTAATGRSSATLNSTSFTSGTPQGTGDIAYIRITCYKTGSQTGDIHDIETIKTMAYVGTDDIPYEPYGYKISILKDSQRLTPIYLGDVQTTRQIVKRELTGEEQWASAGAGASIYYQLNIGALNSVITGVSLSSHFENAQISTSTTDVGVRVYNSSSSNLAALNIRPENVSTDYNTAAKFKQWLADQNTAGTPVIVYYVRTTAIASTVNEPLMKIDEYADSIDSTQSGVTIPTTGGTATIDVDTTVKPSELELTYHGWHTHEPLKRENGAWV